MKLIILEYDRIEISSIDGVKIIEKDNNEDSIINFSDFVIKCGSINASNLNLDGIKIVETNKTDETDE